MATPVLEMRGVQKNFGGVYALKDASLTLHTGDVMALVGENGAGKSTLMRVLTGIYEDDGGEILYEGNRVKFKNAKQSSASGIQIIHQEFNLFPNLTVAENIFLDNPTIRKNGLVSWATMREKATALIKNAGGEFSVDEKVSGLTVQNMQIVEIAKALSCDAKVLIMDEPTSALPEHEVQNLFRTVRALQKQGVAIIYVSHRLHEIFEICNRITVLRDGNTVGQHDIADVTEAEVISAMVGKDVKQLYPKQPAQIGGPVLEVSGLTDGEVVKDASFTVHSGEILGLYGLVGSGATECPDLLFGLAPKTRGKVAVEGKALAKLSAPNAIKAGIAYVPGDRHREGIITQISIRVNLTLSVLKRISQRLFVKKKAEDALVDEYIERLKIKCKSPEQLVGNLSGGNQQKVVISKWLATKPRVLVLNDPTRGVDVGAKAEIYAIISQLAAEGMGVLITSNDIDEVLGMADRILVFSKGRIKQEVVSGDATMQSLLAAAVEG